MSERCIDGRLFRHQPCWDDPYFEHDIGPCPECRGRGCKDIAGLRYEIDVLKESLDRMAEAEMSQDAFDAVRRAVNALVADLYALTPDNPGWGRAP